MEKTQRHHRLIKLVAENPWFYDKQALAEAQGVSEMTVQRDIDELGSNGYEFVRNREGLYYLRASGWIQSVSLKDKDLRQMEVLKILINVKRPLPLKEIVKRLASYDEGETGEKSVERAVKFLEKKQLISKAEEGYQLNTSFLLPPLELNEQEKTLLFEAMKVAKELSPISGEIRATDAKLRVAADAGKQKAGVYVKGRTPIYDLRRSSYCLRLEEAAREKRRVRILYRKNQEEAAREIELNPLGMVYYWVLDNWYLVAQDSEKIKTYSVDRMLDLLIKEEPFDFPQGFSLEEWFRYSWGIYHNASPVKVRIRFYDYYTTLQRVKEELESRKTCVLKEDEQGIIMEDMVEGLDELAVWLRGFGPGAEVLEPEELRLKVIKEFNQLLSMYGEGTEQ